MKAAVSPYTLSNVLQHEASNFETIIASCTLQRLGRSNVERMLFTSWSSTKVTSLVVKTKQKSGTSRFMRGEPFACHVGQRGTHRYLVPGNSLRQESSVLRTYGVQRNIMEQRLPLFSR